MNAGTGFALWLRRIFADDRARGLRMVERARAREQAALRDALDAPRREMAGLGATRVPTVCIGASIDSDGQPFTIRLAERELRSGGHWLVTGATGSGKSFEALCIILQVLRRRTRGLVILDMKGELAGLVRTVVLPSLAASLPDDRAAALLKKIAVVAPFDDAATPPFNALARDRTVPVELQASEVVSSFGYTIGRDLGVIQKNTLLKALMLAMDRGLTLPEIPELLQNDALLRGAVRACRLQEVRSYFASRFPKERSASVASLLSRLDGLLMHPTLRRMLSSRGMIRFDRLLEGAITIVDLGGAPAGMSEVSRFFGQIVFRKLVRAIFARRVERDTPPVTVIADELQAMLSPEIAADFDRVLTLARSQRVFLWCLFQQAAQVESVAPTLLRILRTNTNYQAVFRASIEDARLLSHILPVSGAVPRDRQGFPDPRTPRQLLTPDEERRRLVEQVPSLPDRVFWFWNRRRPYPAILARSPTLDIDGLKARADELPDEIRALVARGVLAVPRDELDRTIEERAHARARIAEGSANAAHTPSTSPGPTPPVGPEPAETDEPDAAWSEQETVALQEEQPPRGRSRRRGSPNLG